MSEHEPIKGITEFKRVLNNQEGPLDERLDARLTNDPLQIEIEEGGAGLEAAVEAAEALADPADDEFRHGLEELLHPKG